MIGSWRVPSCIQTLINRFIWHLYNKEFMYNNVLAMFNYKDSSFFMPPKIMFIFTFLNFCLQYDEKYCINHKAYGYGDILSYNVFVYFVNGPFFQIV